MSEEPYEVGYKKPPVHTRFKKGHKGHARGRSKASPSLSERLDAILDEKLTITENGRSKRLSKEEVFLRQVVNGALARERLACKFLYDYLVTRQRRPSSADTRETDEFLFTELIKELENSRKGGGDVPA